MSDCEGDVEVVVANDVDVPVLINSAPVVTRREKKLPLGWRNFREKRELHLKDSHPPLPESERTETIDPRFHEDVWRWIHGDNPEAEEEYARGQAHVERIQARVKARIERAWDKWRKSVAVVQAKAAAVGVPVYDKHGVEPELWEREGIVLGTGKGKGRGKGKKTTLEDQDEEGEEGREGEGEGEGEEEEEEEESDGGISLSSFSSLWLSSSWLCFRFFRESRRIEAVGNGVESSSSELDSSSTELLLSSRVGFPSRGLSGDGERPDIPVRGRDGLERMRQKGELCP